MFGHQQFLLQIIYILRFIICDYYNFTFDIIRKKKRKEKNQYIIMLTHKFLFDLATGCYPIIMFLCKNAWQYNEKQYMRAQLKFVPCSFQYSFTLYSIHSYADNHLNVQWSILWMIIHIILIYRFINEVNVREKI